MQGGRGYVYAKSFAKAMIPDNITKPELLSQVTRIRKVTGFFNNMSDLASLDDKLTTLTGFSLGAKLSANKFIGRIFALGAKGVGTVTLLELFNSLLDKMLAEVEGELREELSAEDREAKENARQFLLQSMQDVEDLLATSNARNSQLEELLNASEAENSELRTENSDLKTENSDLKAEIARLQEELAQATP